MGIDATRSSTIPAELRSRQQWMRWIYTPDGGKLPLGKSNDPTTWTSFDSIEDEDQIAFTISGADEFCGIDLDGCIVDGAWTEWCEPIFQKFRGVAYCEVSPSGNGVKLTTIATKPPGARCVAKMGEGKQQIECYDHERFWTVTGDVVDGFESIGDGQAAVDWLCETYLKGTERKTGPKRQDSSKGSTPLTLLQRAQAYADKMAPASQGDLRNAAFRNAGHLHAIVGEHGERLSDNEVYLLLRSWNARNTPPLRDDELLEASVNGRTNGTPPADKPPKSIENTSNVDDFVNEHSDGSTPNEKPENEKPENEFNAIRRMKLSEMRVAFPHLKPVVIEGVLRRGETCNIIAASKVGKTFLGIGLAWSIVTGRPWLSHDVQQGKVLIIDNECHGETITDRLYRVANAMQINANDYEDQLEVISLRGANCDINALQRYLHDIKPGEFNLVLLDALYRTLPKGISENDNASMMAIYNKLDYYAALLSCPFAAIHHSSKGDQSEKSIVDVGSGAGSIARATDTHLVIRPHEQPGFAVMEAVTRSFKSPEPLTIGWEYPLWTASTMTPEVKKRKPPKAETQAADDKAADDGLLDALKKNCDRWLSESQLARKTGFGPTRTARAVGRANAAGKIKERRVKRQGHRVLVYQIDPTATATAT